MTPPVRPMLMSKSQAIEIAAALRRAAREDSDGLIRIGYEPRRGIVVQIVKNGETTCVIHETGAPQLEVAA